MIESRCLCGDHVWRVRPPLALLHHCHCSYCRKHQGSAYTTMGGVEADAFEWAARGESIAYASSPDLVRRSCARCGSPVPGDPAAEGLSFVTAGQMEGEPGAPIDAHIFAASKAAWYELEDGLPAFDGYPPGYDAAELDACTSSDPEGEGMRGSCMCGGLRFVLAGAPLAARHCHCLRCRRARGALHASNLVVRQRDLRFTAGADLVRRYRLPEAKFFAQAFCERCGSAAPNVDGERGIAVVPMGALDDAPAMLPQEHIWVASKATWYEIPGALPQYAEGPPA